MPKSKIIQAGILVFMVLALSVWAYLWSSYDLEIRARIVDKLNQWQGKTLNRNFQTPIKSGNLSTDYEIEQAIRDIDSLELNTVNVPVAVNIKDLRSSTMTLDEGSIRKARQLIQKLRRNNLNIILEPYPWIANGEFYETNWNPDDMDAFFNNWKNNVIKPLIANVAVPERVDALCIASNLVHMEEYEDRWFEVIDLSRQYYKGLITYKTNWWYTADWDKATEERYKRKLESGIFAKVDYISIAAYFELSERPVNSVAELKQDLQASTLYGRKQNIVEEIAAFHQKWSKPVLFGELGFPRREYAAKQPWHPSPSQVENGAEQARCFQAYKETFTQNWFLGFSIFAIGNRQGEKNYYPSQESVAVIKSWN